MSRTKKWTLLSPSGFEQPVAIPVKNALQAMYKLIGSGCHTVQMITLHDGRRMWMDEDGKYHQQAYNPHATELFQKSGGMPDDFIVGPVILEGTKRR